VIKSHVGVNHVAGGRRGSTGHWQMFRFDIALATREREREGGRCISRLFFHLFFFLSSFNKAATISAGGRDSRSIRGASLPLEVSFQDVFHLLLLLHLASPCSVIRTTSSRTVTFRREMLLERARVSRAWKMHLSFATRLIRIAAFLAWWKFERRERRGALGPD